LDDNSNKVFHLFGLTEIDKIQQEIQREMQQEAQKEMQHEAQKDTQAVLDPFSGAIAPSVAPTAPPFIFVEDEYTQDDFPQYAPQQYTQDDFPQYTPQQYTQDDSPQYTPQQYTPSQYQTEQQVSPSRHHTPHTTPKKSGLVAALLLICTLGTGMLGVGIGAGWAYFNRQEAVELTQGDTSLTSNSYIFEPIAQTQEPAVATLSDMLELVTPSVVGIITYREQDSRSTRTAQTSHGSGIIFADTDDRIYIATNLHVVRGGQRWDITIGDSEPISARPVGDDRSHDLAVLYVEKHALLQEGIDNIAFAAFGDSDQMKIGDTVLAIGHALGSPLDTALGGGMSVTSGIISALERPVRFPDRAEPRIVLQTDAAINYGNSGGALINTKGEIVGITISPAQDTSGMNGSLSEGMGYGISSNIAVPVLTQIVADERIPAMGVMGVSLADDAENRAGQWNIPALGALILFVQENSPAQRADILPDDVITAFDGQPIFDMPQLQAAVRSKEIGDIVEVRILRGGRFTVTVNVELEMIVRDTF